MTSLQQSKNSKDAFTQQVWNDVHRGGPGRVAPKPATRKEPGLKRPKQKTRPNNKDISSINESRFGSGSMIARSSSKSKKDYKEQLRVPILKQANQSRNNLATDSNTYGTSSQKSDLTTVAMQAPNIFDESQTNKLSDPKNFQNPIIDSPIIDIRTENKNDKRSNRSKSRSNVPPQYVSADEMKRLSFGIEHARHPMGGNPKTMPLLSEHRPSQANLDISPSGNLANHDL